MNQTNKGGHGKEVLLLRCARTGRVIGINRNCRWGLWVMPFLSVLALIWFLVRVIPKPSRAAYPCQRVGASVAFGGLVYVASIFGLVAGLRHARRLLSQHRYAAAGICLAIGLLCSVVVKSLTESVARAENTGTFTPSDSPNQPVGTARGINPGRVAWAYDLAACNWNGSSSYWLSSGNNDQARITAMMNKAICSVAGQSSIGSAWDALFRYKNGGAPYVAGEKIAVKLNLNNGGNYDNQIDASPQTVYALLDGLVREFGVNQADITLCDPARENQCSAVYDYCHTAFPNVIYDTSLGGFTANAFAYSVSGPTERSLSTAIVNAKHLITLAVLKRHCTPSATFGTDGVDYGQASVTLLFKSCWGIIGNNRASQHSLLHDWNYPMASYNQLVDIFGSKHINGKTVLNLIDGLYSGDRWSSQPRRWQLAPFNGRWPSSIFVSQDPVALESVGLDFLRAEMPLIKNGDRHLHEAARASQPPSATNYRPDGFRLAGLGVHEHWNNSTDKKYSHNLGTGAGIELVALPAGAYSVEVTNPPGGAVFTQGSNIMVQAIVNSATNPISRVAFYQDGAELLGFCTNTPYAIDWSNAPVGTWALTAVATDSTGLCKTSTCAGITVQGSMPPQFQTVDIGSVGLAGSVGFCRGQFSISGSGADIWNTADGFRFVYAPLTGDGRIITRVKSVQKTDPWGKAGVMIRESLNASSSYAFALVSAGSGTTFQYRTNTAGSSWDAGGSAAPAPYWLQLSRTGNVFRAYSSPDGATWTQLGTNVVVTMASSVYAGLAVTAHNNSALNTSVFDNVTASSVTNAPPTVSWMVPTNNSSFVQTKMVTLALRAQDLDGTVSNVAVFNGSNLLGTVSYGRADVYSLAWTNVASGNHVLNAVATDNSGATNAFPATVSIIVRPLTLFTCSSPADGQFSLTFQGQNGQNYVLETSTNLTEWTPLLTNAPSNGTVTFSTAAVEPRRFYRAREQ
jgi:hypothetical protein